jgi:hypothetical protein
MNTKRPDTGRASRVLAAACLTAALAATAPADDKITYQDHALPVLRQRCGTCHNADKKTGGLDVTSFAAIMQGGGSGDVLVSGDAAKSYLFRVVNHDDEPKMPPDAPPIPEPERKLLRAWIDGGLLETKGSVAVAPPKKVDVAMASPAGERPAVQPLPAHLPLEPVTRTAAVDACGSIATSPWAPLAAVCGQKQVLLYRTDSLQLAGVLPFPEGRPHVVRFSRGGGLVLAGGGVGAASGRVVVWNVKNGRRVRAIGDEIDAVLAADISPDQRLVALGGPQRAVRIFSLETGQKLHDLVKHTDWVQAAAFSPDGVLLATADRSGGVLVWEAVSGRDYLLLQAHPAGVTSLAWRGDSNLLATGCEDGQIRLWEPANGGQVKAWAAHPGGVASVGFTRDGRVYSVGRDKVPKLWKSDGTQERAFEACADIGLAVAMCDETNRLVVGDWTGEIRVWNAADAARVGGLDANPPRLADRLAAATQAVQARTAELVDGEKPIAAALKQAADQIVALTAQHAAAQAEAAAAQARLADAQKQLDTLAAAAAAAQQAQAAAAAAVTPLDQQLQAIVAESKAAGEAVAQAGEDAAKKEAAQQGVAAVLSKQAAAQAKLDVQKAEAAARAQAAAAATQAATAAAAPRDQAKTAAEAAAKKLEQATAAVAAARQQESQQAAKLAELKNRVAAATAEQARWQAEREFQAGYDTVFAEVRQHEQAVEQAEADMAAAEARRQAEDQTRAAHVAKRDGFQRQIESLQGMIAAAEKESQELAARIAARAGELTAAQAAIAQAQQAAAALDASAKGLQQELAAQPADAELKAAQAALVAAVQAKQTQIKQKQETLAALAAEKTGWEQAVAAKRAAVETHKAGIATATAAMQEAAKPIEAAMQAVATAAKVVDEKRAVVVQRQQALDAVGRRLDALQGISG